MMMRNRTNSTIAICIVVLRQFTSPGLRDEESGGSSTGQTAFATQRCTTAARSARRARPERRSAPCSTGPAATTTMPAQAHRNGAPHAFTQQQQNPNHVITISVAFILSIVTGKHRSGLSHDQSLYNTPQHGYCSRRSLATADSHPPRTHSTRGIRLASGQGRWSHSSRRASASSRHVAGEPLDLLQSLEL